MRSPLLLRPALVRIHARGDPDLWARWAYPLLGSLRGVDPDAIRRCAVDLDSEFPKWHQALAREVLLLGSADRDLAVAIEQVVGEETTPGPGLPTLRALKELPNAIALLPVNTSRVGPGSLAGVLVVKDERDTLRGFGDSYRLPINATGLADAETLPCFLIWEHGTLPAGQSWQLAAALAVHTLSCDSTAAQELRLDLARNWIATGMLGDRGRVEPVELGNKLSLWPFLPLRRWLLPSGNYGDSNPALEEFRIATLGRHHWAPSLGIATQHLEGHSTQEDDRPADWPEQLDTMHCLVSAALGPQLAPFLQARPRRAVLWCSPEMCERGKVLRQALLTVCQELGVPPPGSIEFPLMPSGSVAAAEQALLQDISIRSPLRPTLFNITGGNLLMRIAVMNIARLNPALQLIYRDITAGMSLEYTVLTYHGSAGTTRRLELEAQVELSRQINWRQLVVNHYVDVDRSSDPARVPIDVNERAAALVRRAIPDLV